MAGEFDRMREDKRRREAAEYQRRLEAARRGELGPHAKEAVRRSDAKGTTRRQQLVERRGLEPWVIEFKHDGRRTVWTRYARTADEARRSALTAAHREYPGEKISNLRASRGGH